MSRTRHKVTVLVLPGVVPFDLGIPCAIFGSARIGGAEAYQVTTCGPRKHVATRHFRITLDAGLAELDEADTIIVPGTADPLAPLDRRTLAALRNASARGARIASICSGAFVLAAAGLLDRRRATTHWRLAADLASAHPAIDVDPNVLFVDDGAVLTSAGMSAGIDLCLHMVRQDFGQTAAADAARHVVAPIDRDGGQAQFIRHEPTTSRASLAAILDWMAEHAAESLDIARLAGRAAMSERTFLRQFREQTGTTPIQWLLATRIRLAQQLLEGTTRPIEEIALSTGFESPVTFRTRFRRQVGLAPKAYRQRFNAAGAARIDRTRRTGGN